MRVVRPLAVAAVAAVAGLSISATGVSAKSTPADVRRGLEGLIATTGGPPGAIATLYRNGHLTTISARADVGRPGAPRPAEHMRIASVSKAFSGAVTLSLVRAGKLGLDDTIAQRLPGMPPAWGAVTVRQLLNHTGGMPDYTKSNGFEKQLKRNPRAYISPQTAIGWVRSDPLRFAPGTDYEYSNTDNIVIGLIVEAVTGEGYGDALKRVVFGPAGLRQTSLPTKVAIPKPFIHGYATAAGEKPEDVSTILSPSGPWASGGIVSTPRELNAFIRADLGLGFFGRAEQEQQMRFHAGGESVPPGPGKNSAGLALFRYRTRCGTVFGHTGDLPGYAQWAAATADGSRGVTTTLNINAPTGKLLTRLRRVQETAVCVLLGK